MASIQDNKNEIPRITREMAELQGTEMSAGVHGDEGSFMSMLATVHEFGVTIQVTTKMRGWFAANGFPLKESTTEIVIPARPFIRPAWDILRRSLNGVKEQQLKRIVDGDQTAFGAASLVALHMRDTIRQQFGKHGPPLSSMTIQMKGSSSKLEDTGRLRQSIAAKVNESEVG